MEKSSILFIAFLILVSGVCVSFYLYAYYQRFYNPVVPVPNMVDKVAMRPLDQVNNNSISLRAHCTSSASNKTTISSLILKDVQGQEIFHYGSSDEILSHLDCCLNGTYSRSDRLLNYDFCPGDNVRLDIFFDEEDLPKIASPVTVTLVLATGGQSVSPQFVIENTMFADGK